MKRLLLATLFFLYGCSDPYGACEKAAADIGTSIGAGMKTVDSLRVSGLITPQEETQVLGYLKFANDANGAFGVCAQQAHIAGSKSGAYTACAAAFQTTLANPTELALIRVGNSQAQQNVQTIVNGVNTGITAVLTAIGGR
jgi:hypothetical protein